MIGNNVIFPGMTVRYDENGSDYIVLSYGSAKMKIGGGFWIDAVTYSPLLQKAVYIRDVTTFNQKFSLVNDDASR